MANVIAVIVTHNPPEGFAQRLEVVLNEVNSAVVVDNHSDDAPPPGDGRIDVIRNAENKGLAAALNQGIRQALSRDAEWVLLLDHDSTPEPGMVAKMLAAYQTYPEKEHIGLVAPEIKEENIASGTRYLVPKGKFRFGRMTLDEPTNDRALSVITSGSLIKADMFGKLGLMPEHFFIDYIDYAFCLKLKERGYRILLVKDAVLQHRLGDKKTYGRIIVSQHSASRRHTIFRNRIWLWKRYAAAFPAFVIHDALAAGYDMLRIALYEKQKWQKCKAVVSGICAGLRREP